MDDTDDDITTNKSTESEHPANAVSDGTPQTFEGTIEAGHLKHLLTIVEAVVEECRFHLGTDALYIRAISPANVAMTDSTASPDAFETYESNGDTIGLNYPPEAVISLAVCTFSTV